MDKGKITKVAITLLALGGLGYIVYYFYSKNKLKSGNADKDNRKILFTRTDI
jgi:uncharacterized membrane protein YebE (DUF533 family)